jgi:UDP-N-acetylglucosamine--N-acetylmuramyl-(pentapeptide) pyrophosphoryl-undecaprenol N-acetylglucosamine transferase
MKIMLTGGGTMGPVTPLLAVAQLWRKVEPGVELVWVGTSHGPEKTAIEAENIPFYTLPTARLPRYLSSEWVTLPFNLLRALFLAGKILRRERPDLIVSAGGYTGVPIIIAGWLSGIPAWVHQQDAVPLLANRLTAPLAKYITVAWEATLKYFPKNKTQWIGNPVRPSILEGQKEKAREFFSLEPNLPTVLIFGGGTGSAWLNHMMEEVGGWLITKANVIHITGQGKKRWKLVRLGARYHTFEFLAGEMPHALAAADVVLARAGMGTIAELAALRKAAIFIPLPRSLQMKNVKMVERAQCAIVLPQIMATTGDVKNALSELLDDPARRQELSQKMGHLLPRVVGDEIVAMVKARCLKK